KILHTSGQHNIALFGAGNLGQAIASSDIFADHGFQIVAIFDVDPRLVGERFGDVEVRGVGYNVESLVTEVRKILRTSGQHNIALFGAGNLGQAIATSSIFADHGFQVVAVFDSDPSVVGNRIGEMTVRDIGDLPDVVAEEEIVVGVLAVPAEAAQDVADRLVKAGVKIIFNYSEQLLQVPPEVTVHTSSPAVDLLYALYFYLA
ncbi:MAG TPA: redox-sensing transcriptional repressor Rex, partial [Solirubrobacterales bacterium]|nr:redox-sensing transcriptional repressor Rex [Solirubrobacterales bacterium]